MDNSKWHFQFAPAPTDGEPITILTGEAPKQLDPFDYQGFSYEALSTPSFISLVKNKASQEHAVVFANNRGFYAICDDTVEDRYQDNIKMDFVLSNSAAEWGDVLTEKGKKFTIKQIIDFFKRRDTKEIENLDALLYAFKNFKYAKSITGDFTYDDRNNYNFSVKVRDTEETIRIPALVEANIEIFKGSGFFSAIDIEVEVLEPNNASETPVILLSCPTFLRHYTKAQEVELETLRTSLPEWLVVEGKA